MKKKTTIRPGDVFDYEKYDLNTTEYVCANHLEDKYIRNKIRQSGQKGKCDFCNKHRLVVPLSELLKIIIIGIEYLLEDPGDSRYYNKEGRHGYDGNTMDFYDLWHQDELGIGITDDKLAERIYQYLENDSLYCRKDEFYSESEDLDMLWRNFKETVKHKARFVFYYKDVFKGHEFVDPFYILERVQKSIRKYDLIAELPANTILYRTRQHKSLNDVKKGSDIASAPQHLATVHGRMNPAGISMFYSSRSKSLTITEVVNSTIINKPFYTTAIFRTKDKLRLVDLTSFPDTPSIFDTNYNGDRETLFFLKEFVKDICKPIHTDDAVIEYIPTQIVTEYIKFNPKMNVDGIIYPSSRIGEKNNIVLFFDHDQSLSNLTFSPSSLKTSKI